MSDIASVTNFLDTLRAMPLRPQLRLVGVAGPAGVGKSTIARLIAESNSLWSVVSFADPIRECVLACFPWWDSRSVFEDKERQLQCAGGFITSRHLMRTIGDHVRALAPDAYVDFAAGQWRELIERGRSVVVDDVRFVNEASAIRNYGGVVIHLCRDGVVYTREHASEYGITPAPDDFIMCNDVDMGCLSATVRQ